MPGPLVYNELTDENTATLLALREYLDDYFDKNGLKVRYYLTLGIEGSDNPPDSIECSGIASRRMSVGLATALASVILSHVIANSDSESTRTLVSMAHTLLQKALTEGAQ